MKKVLMFGFALLIALSFVSTGIAQDKTKAPAKAAPAAEKPAAAPEKAVAPAPEKAVAAPAEKAAAPEKAAKPKAKAKAKKAKKACAGFAGAVVNYDAAAKVATVQGKKATIGFDLANAKLKGYKSVDDVKVGDKVVVKYLKDGIMVQKIGGKKQCKAEKAAKPKKAGKAKKAAFKDVDKDGNGKITVEELVVVFVNVTPEQFKALDKNGDGALDESEYKAVK